MSGPLFDVMHALVTVLEAPIMATLLVAVTVGVWQTGVAVGERWWGLRQLATLPVAQVERLGRRRIGAADMLARLGPMLGLMGTLIPLGPGLAGLGEGNVAVLAQAVTTAFDTTVVGLLVGAVGFVLGRLRRSWYDSLLDRLERARP